MKALHDKKWDVESIWHFLNNPGETVKGTKMSFAGLKKPEELAAAIVFLRSLGSENVPLPAPKKGEPEGAKADATKDVNANTKPNNVKSDTGSAPAPLKK
jgi:hypothetical protein